MRAIEIINVYNQTDGYLVEHDNFVRYFNANCYKPSANVPTKKAIIPKLRATTYRDLEYMMRNQCRNTKKDRRYFTGLFNSIFNTL